PAPRSTLFPYTTLFRSVLGLGNVEDTQPIHLPAVGEAEQVIVRRADEEVLDEVVFLGRSAGDAASAAMLRTKGGQRHPLDVALRSEEHTSELQSRENLV